MIFEETLSQGTFCLHLHGNTREEIIREFVDHMADDSLIFDRDEVFRAMMERERIMPTGLQHGVAAPHGKTEAVSDLVVAFGLHPTGVDFGAQDGHPCRIFIVTVSSILRTGPHVRYLAAISRLLMNASIRAALLKATSRKEIVNILCSRGVACRE